MKSFFRLMCLMAVIVLPPAIAQGLPDLGESAQSDLTPLAEKRVGETIMRDIRLREPTYMDDPELNGYLNRLGGRLVAQAAEARQEFEFFALKDSTLNAFALPGGFVGVHSGLILAAQSESELASVLAHEISHVTQRHLARLVGKQSQSQIGTLAALAIAILAARSNPDVALGAAVAGQAAGIQHQLNYSRDFEQEADRLGIQLLEKAGYDVRGMGSFFERLQRFGRLYENNAPGYLRTHPLTTDRISDMENRIQQRPYRQVADSLDFLLIRAKLRALEGTPQDAVQDFSHQVRERKFNSEAATRYGLAQALMRAKNYPAAEKEVQELRRLRVTSPLLETLAAELRTRQNDPAAAVAILSAALARFPQERAISYALTDNLLTAGRAAEALKVVNADLQDYPTDARSHALQAKAYAILGKRLQQHRAQAEAYYLQGQLLAAIEQLQFAQKAGDGDFYEQSQVDSRLRELKRQQAEEAKHKRP